MSSSTMNQLAVAGATMAAIAFIVAYRDYRAYVALGPHGLPDTFSGWWKQLKMSRRARKDTTVPAPYDLSDSIKLGGPHADTSFLSSNDLPVRKGNRPSIPGFAAPQRQVSDQATEDMKERMMMFLDHLAAANEGTLQRGLSKLEGPVPALQLRSEQLPEVLRRTRGEIAHVHPPDGSTHAVLSLKDSRKVIESSWGQRHRLSGTILGWGYTLVYAPRDDEELEIWKDIIVAASRHGCVETSEIIIPK